MKPIAEWPVFVKLTSVLTVVGTLGTAWSYKDALAEIVPFPTKAAMAEAIGGVRTALDARLVVTNSSLDKILWSQVQVQYRLLETDISNLRTQKIQLKDMIERETDPTESIQKQVRLDAISHDLTSKESVYDCVSKQLERHDIESSC